MNLPNALSLFRLFLVPVYLCVFFSGIPYAYTIAVAVFVIAGITDVIDGRLARKYDQVTILGRILDPLADKLMVMSALVSMSMVGMIPASVSILYIAKESLQVIGGAILYKFIKDMPPSNLWGKAATLLFYVAIISTILFHIQAKYSALLFACAFACVFAALSSYLFKGVKLLKENTK